MRLLVCGGRDFTDEGGLWDAIDSVRANLADDRNLIIIHGACPTGADRLADRYAEHHGLRQLRFPARWRYLGGRAGPARNQQMLDADGGPDLVLAFPGGAGTHDMIRKARAAGVEVMHLQARDKGGQ